MRLKLGPSSQAERERAKEDTQGERGTVCVYSCLCVPEFTYMVLSVFCACVSLYIVEYALWRDLHRMWHEVGFIRCQQLCGSLDSEVSLMTWPIHQQPSMLHYLSVYAVEPCCLHWVWVFGRFWLFPCDRAREFLTAKPRWGCCGNKTLGTSGCVANEEV